MEQYEKRIDQLTQRVREVETDKTNFEVKEAYSKQEMNSELKQAKEQLEKVEIQNSRLQKENDDKAEEATRLRHETLALKSQLMDQEKNRETFMRELVKSSNQMSFKMGKGQEVDFERMEPERDHY